MINVVRSIRFLSAGVVLLAVAGCTSKAATEPVTQQPRALPVRGVPVEQRTLEDTLVVTGTLKPRVAICSRRSTTPTTRSRSSARRPRSRSPMRIARMRRRSAIARTTC
jgi:multidrug efflux pump subunit AcrA (membrane-fusion protein)